MYLWSGWGGDGCVWVGVVLAGDPVGRGAVLCGMDLPDVTVPELSLRCFHPLRGRMLRDRAETCRDRVVLFGPTLPVPALTG